MLQFRRLGVDDAGEALTLQRAAFVSEAALYETVRIPPLIDTIDDLRRELAATITTGAFLDSRLVGSARLTLELPTGWISRVAVAPDQQGRGFGSALLREVERTAPATVRRFQLAAANRSANNIGLYRHLGYVEFGRGPDAVGIEMVFMVKPRVPGVLLISGSLRTRSVNTAVLRTLVDVAGPVGLTASLFGATTELPYFDPDCDDEDLPQSVAELRRAIDAANALVFSTPEYAGALPGAFKNLLDWTVGGMEMAGKPVGWVNVSNNPGRAAATYASLETVLGYVNADIVPGACVAIPIGHAAVGPDAMIAEAPVRAELKKVCFAILARIDSRALG